MFFKSKKELPKLDLQQKELFEHAQQRIKEKRGLYSHMVVFFVGAMFMAVFNLMLKFGEGFQVLGYDWFVWGILIWSFFLFIHIFRVLLFSQFMDKAWQAKQLEYLVAKQKAKIAKMEQKLESEFQKEVIPEKTTLLETPNMNDSEKIE